MAKLLFVECEIAKQMFMNNYSVTNFTNFIIQFKFLTYIPVSNKLLFIKRHSTNFEMSSLNLIERLIIKTECFANYVGIGVDTVYLACHEMILQMSPYGHSLTLFTKLDSTDAHVGIAIDKKRSFLYVGKPIACIS